MGTFLQLTVELREVCALALLLIAACTSRLSQAADSLRTPIDPQQGIRILEGFQGGIEGYQWGFCSTKITAKNPKATELEKLQLETAGPEQLKGTALFDLQHMYTLVEYEEVQKWFGGAAPYCSRRGEHSFDGDTYRSWQRFQHGTELPSLDPTVPPSQTLTGLAGVIDRTERGWQEGSQLPPSAVGLCYMPPMVWTHRKTEQTIRLTELLKRRLQEGEAIPIVQCADGHWEIEIKDDTISAGVMRLFVDPARNGAVTGWEFGGPDKKGEYVAWSRTVIRLQALPGGMFAPSEAVSLNTLDSQGERLVFSNVIANPKVNGSSFQVTFPKGTFVDDYVEGKSYTVGMTPNDDANAVKSFLQRHGLEPLPGAPTPRGARKSRLAAMVSSVALLALIGVWFLRRRAKSKALGVFSLLVVIGGAAPVDAAVAGTTAADGWTVECRKGEEVPISQCGFQAALVALELFQCHYDPAVVSKCLKPTAEGISLGDLADVLEAHGLKVEARQEVEIHELASRLRPCQLAIFPVPSGKLSNHYLLAVRNGQGRVLILDPPARVLDFNKYAETRFQPAFSRLVALFISHPATQDELANRIVVKPEQIDLGRYEVGDTHQSELTGSFVVTNPTDHPVMVSKAQKSCGCTSITWSGGLIPARGEQRVEVRARTLSWGVGPHQELVVLNFPDRSEQRIVLTGEGYLKGKPIPAKTRRETLFEVPAVIDGKTFETQEAVLISRGPEQAASLEVHTEQSWLHPTLQTADREVRLVVEVRLSEEELRKLAMERERLLGSVYVVDKKRGDATDVDVVVIQKPLATVTPRVVQLACSGSDSSVQVTLAPAAADQRFKLARVWSEPAGVEFQVVDPEATSPVIQCRAAKECQAGKYYVCSGELTCGTATQVVTFVVHTTP